VSTLHTDDRVKVCEHYLWHERDTYGLTGVVTCVYDAEKVHEPEDLVIVQLVDGTEVYLWEHEVARTAPRRLPWANGPLLTVRNAVTALVILVAVGLMLAWPHYRPDTSCIDTSRLRSDGGTFQGNPCPGSGTP